MTDQGPGNPVRVRLKVLVLVLASLSGCRGQESADIEDHFSRSGRVGVDLSVAVPGAWDRVCVLGPYSDNAEAARTLGFEWPAESLTEIHRSDSISVLVFAQGSTAMKHVEHSRGAGDFSNLSGRCFPKARARFVQVAQPIRGWPGLFPDDEA